MTQKKNLAMALHHKGKISDAIKGYINYLKEFPEDSEIWMNLGAAYRSRKNFAMAIGSYKKSLSIKDNAGAHSNLGNVLKEVNRYEEAVAHSEAAYALEPNSKLYQFNLAVTYHETKKFSQAIEQLDALIEKTPKKADTIWERSLVHLASGNFAEGWRDYSARLRMMAFFARKFPMPMWEGEDIKGKRLLIVAEQGYGDTLLAARLLPLLHLMGVEIILECKKELHPIFAHLPVKEFTTPPPKSNKADGQPAEPENIEYPKADYFVFMMSLFGLLKIDSHNIPKPVEVHVPEASIKKFAFMNEQPNKKIGFVWSGSLTFQGNDKRANSFERFLQLAELPNVALYSLQKGTLSKEIIQYQATPLVQDLSPLIEDFGDTAAAIQQLDLIVMTDSSVAHLAGSMGKKVINLLNSKPYWLYFPEKESTEWYPSMQLIRQTTPGDWQGVWKQLMSVLKTDIHSD